MNNNSSINTDIMNFLSIDFSTDIGSLFIKIENKTFSKVLQSDKFNNDLLMKQILDFFAENNINFADISKIFVNQGPGNFSGLRGSLATAKGIGSGFPLGACLATTKASIGMSKGKHGSTYGGNPLAVSVGREVLKIVSNKKFLNNVDMVSRYLWKKLKNLQSHYDEIVDVRGAGLLLGIKTNKNNIMISNILKKNKLLTVPAGDNIIRLAPPLIINKKHVDQAINIIDETFKKLS